MTTDHFFREGDDPIGIRADIHCYMRPIHRTHTYMCVYICYSVTRVAPPIAQLRRSQTRADKTELRQQKYECSN